jgi:TolB-like protein
MASILPGYEYDIFISYRQKDNKGDRWVSEFVEALKTELESTFKEEISVYFDINPHDGLLETHDVDASLKEKLKCLVFIPIISRTYCDPKSFAWEHEFKAFIEQASQDQFGMKVKLPGGNVASRVLPIQIHDLDSDDRKLVENELGGFLRGIEFIYREPGVNKPLASGDDEKRNLNNTKYRIQINKVANSIKEIINGLKTPERDGEEIIKDINEEKPSVRKNLKTKIIAGTLILFALIVLGYFIVPKLIKPKEQIKKSIAVLPFKLLSDEPDKQYLADGMMDAILLHLSKIKDLRVMSRTSVEQYRETTKTIHVIGQELGVAYLLEGSFQKSGDNVKLIIQLIKASEESHAWANEYNRNWKDIFSVQSEVAQTIASELHAIITPEEKDLIEKRRTKNMEAYNFYLKGRFFWNAGSKEGQIRSVKYFEMSAAEDPDYALAYGGLADAYLVQASFGWFPMEEGIAKAKKYALRALDIDKNLAESHATLGMIYCFEWKWKEARDELLLATRLDPKCVTAHLYYSELVDAFRQNKDARIHINLAIDLDPSFFYLYLLSSDYFYNEGKFDESLKECKKAFEINPDYSNGYWKAFRIYSRQGDGLKAVEAIQNIFKRDTLTIKYVNTVNDVYSQSGLNGLMNWLIELELQNPEPSPYALANWYAMLSKKEQTLYWLERAIEQRQSGIPKINNNLDYKNLRSEPRFIVLIKQMGLSY